MALGIIRLALLCVAGAVPSLKDDTCCSIEETQWYRPEDHFQHLLEYAQDLDVKVPKIYSVLDLFGASKRVAKTWIENCYSAVAYDIKISATHDICTEAGFKELITMGMQMKDDGLMMACPPCSLFGPACSSVHRRCWDNPYGNTKVFKPSGSWAFKMGFMQTLLKSSKMFCVNTWMGFFGHDMQKNTHIQTNLVSIKALKRKMTKADRARINRRFAHRQQNRKVKRDYHSKKRHADGSTSWQGGRDLSSSATFTHHFCRELLKC